MTLKKLGGAQGCGREVGSNQKAKEYLRLDLDEIMN